MLIMNLKARITHKAFWLGIISLVVLLLQELGLNQIANYIPKNYADIINTIFAVLAAIGITVDTSTPGMSDIVPGQNEQGTTNAITVDSCGMSTTGNLKIESQDSTSQIEFKNDSIGQSVQADNLASSKIQVDIPQE